MFSRIIAMLRTVPSEPSLKKLRNRLLTVNLISLTLVVVVAFSLIYIDYYNRTQKEIEATLDSIPPGVLENIKLSQQLAGTSTYTSDPDAEGLTIRGDPVIPVDYSKSFVVNIKDDGDITIFSLLDITNEDYFFAIEAALEKDSASGSLYMADREWRYCIKQPPERSGGRPTSNYRSSIVYLDVDEASRGLRELALSLFIIGIVAIGAILLVSLMVANRAIRPVEESMARQRRFVADASHELKTPIAVIAASAEAAKSEVFELEGTRGAADDAARSEASRWIDNISVETTRMDGLIKSLLALAKAEETQVLEAPFNLYEAIREEAARVETFLFEKNIAFSFEPPDEEDGMLSVISDRAKVRTILSVLIENAVKYTPGGGSVTITAGRVANHEAFLEERSSRSEERSSRSEEQRSAGFHVTVTNTGTFILPEDVERIFDRFYRTDRSRNSETGGHGIGLSIAKEIARSLGGGLEAASEQQPDGSAVNSFTLYI